MLMFLVRTVIAALIIGVVSEIAHRSMADAWSFYSVTSWPPRPEYPTQPAAGVQDGFTRALYHWVQGI